VVEKAEPVIEYVLSCHGNQNRYIVDRYKELRHLSERRQREGSISQRMQVYLLHENDSKNRIL